ncbi:unnamed protein product, partial [Symbiodinium sp. CCMP2456]
CSRVDLESCKEICRRHGWAGFTYWEDKGYSLAQEAYKPLQRGGPVLSCDDEPTIAERCGRSPAQVCLRWNLEQGNAIVFKSLTPSRIEENVDVFDFSLGSDEVAALDTVTTHKVRAEAQSHWHLRRSGTDAPRGPGLRPEKRTVQEARRKATSQLVLPELPVELLEHLSGFLEVTDSPPLCAQCRNLSQVGTL